MTCQAPIKRTLSSCCYVVGILSFAQLIDLFTKQISCLEHGASYYNSAVHVAQPIISWHVAISQDSEADERQ